MKELLNIQSKLNAPKNQVNSFGGFNYRSAEDILEAVKPLLKREGCILLLSDEVVNIGERYYVKATATLQKDDKEISVTAYARESAEKKGMDSSQVTGSTSSYARKYALNGLFAIDDGKDADSDDNRELGKKKKVKDEDEDRNYSRYPLQHSDKPTIKQVNYLKSLGWDGNYSTLSFEEADKQIKLLAKNNE